MRSIAQSHPVGIIGPVITGNAFFPIWYHIHGFAGPHELGWSDTLYSFLESDGPVQCNAGLWENGTYLIPGIFRHPDGNRHGRYPAFPGQQFGTGIMRSIAQSHPVGLIGPVITGNAFFPIWYHIHGFAGPRELGWSDTLYSFLESDGPVQCNAPTCLTLTPLGPSFETIGWGCFACS